MNKTTKKIIYISLFVATFVSLLLIATFYDYRISEILAGKGMQNGEYFSTNIFGRIFEVIGEMPLYAFMMFASAIIVCFVSKKENIKFKKGFQTFFYLIGFGGSFFGFYKIGKYLAELHPETLSFLHEELWMMVIMAVLALLLHALLCYLLYKKLSLDLIKKLMPFAVVILFSAALSQGFVQGIKPIVGRERFRAIYYLTYRGITDHNGFTNWYVINGSNSKLASQFASELGVTSTFFSSFPSGHTCGAGITYSLICLPYCFEKLNNKKYRWFFIVVPIFITGLVAISRIVVGAHYMSDVLFGGSAAFISAVIGLNLYDIIIKKYNIKL